MIDLNNLIDLLPSYFKEYDSYKDSNGKGLLEKLLNICGEYFQNENLAELDSFLENHSVSGINELYVNNLWEFLGEFPLLQSDTFNYTTFAQIFKGDNLDEAKSKSRIKSNSVLQDLKSTYTVRNILPHVISLYKIRGTKQFFDIVFRLYNLTSIVKVVDSYNDLSTEAKKRVPQYLYNSDVAIFKHLPSFDEAEFDDATYDIGVKCNTCIAQYFEINTSLLGTPVDKYIQAIENLVSKFVPFYINPIFVYTGDKADELYQYSIKVNMPNDLPLAESTYTIGNLIKGSMPNKQYYYPDRGNIYSPLKNIYPIDYIEATVEIKKGYQEYLVGYKTTNSYFIVNPEVRYSTDKPYRIMVPGDYIFIPLNYILCNSSAFIQEKVNGIPTGMLTYSGNTFGAGYETQLPVRLSITEDIYSSQYSIRGSYADNNKYQLEQIGDIVYYNVYASLDYQITSLLPNGSQQFKNVFLDIEDIICIRTPSGGSLVGEVKGYISNGHTLHYTQFPLTEKGLYTFALKVSPDIRVDVLVGATKEYEEAFNSIELTVNPSTNFIIRNNEYAPGDKAYTSYDSFIAKGVKGAFYVEGTSYKPWDSTLQLNCKTRGGEPKNIILSSGTTEELIKVDAQGKASYTFPNTLGIYSLYPEGKPAGFTPITLVISAQDDSLGVQVSLRSWYINPSSKVQLEEGSDLSLNAYATIDVNPSGLAPNYHPCIILWKGSVLPTDALLASLTKGTGIPSTTQGQQLLSNGQVVGKIYQLNWYKDNNYSAPIEFSNISDADKGNWVTCIVQDINELKVVNISGRPSTLAVAPNQQFNIDLLAYVNTNVGFFGIASDKSIWTGLQQNANSQIASSEVYITGTANWVKGQDKVIIIPCTGTLRSQEGMSFSQWTQSPFINLKDSEGNTFNFSNWDDDYTLEEVTARGNYGFPLEGNPKTITFYGVKEDGTYEKIFDFKLAFPDHVSTITSDKASQEFPYGTTSPINVTLKVTSNRLEGPWDIYVNGSNKGKTNANGEIVLSLAIPGEYNIFADLMGTGSASNSKNPAISLKYTVAPPPKTATPKANPTGGTVAKDSTVALSCDTSGAKIYYTTDGSTPTTSSTLYSGPITISKDTIIKAMASAPDHSDSDVGSWAYTIPTLSKPTASLASGTEVEKGTKVTLSSPDSEANIYYSTDGSTNYNTLYSGPITINQAVTLKAICRREGYNDSEASTFSYTIELNAFILECSEATEVTVHYNTNKTKTFSIPANIKTKCILGEEVNNLYNFLKDCTTLIYADITNIDISKVTDIGQMFGGCTSLKEVKGLDTWDISKVKNISYLFSICNNLTTFNISTWNTGSVTDMGCMFQACSSITSIDLSHFDISKVEDMAHMFFRCSNLTSIKLGKTSQPLLEDIYYMFSECPKLTSVDLSTWGHLKTEGVLNETLCYRECFKDSPSVNYLKSGQGFKDYCMEESNKRYISMKIPEALLEGGSGTWEIV